MAIEGFLQLKANCAKSPERVEWLLGLPDTIERLIRRWSLTLGARCEEGSCAWVAQAQLADGTCAVLKVGIPHMEAEHELDGLRFWNGNPTVKVLRADEPTGAMLLERCEPGTPLCTLPEPDQDEVISGLLRRLWRRPPASHRFRHLSALMEYWSNQTLGQVDHWPDAALVRDGLQLLRESPGTAPTDVLLATDLHAANILRAQREPWLVIDPKPFVGDPAYDVTQHLFNCAERMIADPDGMIRRVAELLDVDQQRVRQWTFARAAAEPRDEWNNDGWLMNLARAIAL